ncbi:MULTISPECIES: SIS domain-containing protein [unclassified Pseudomonas]|uniref:SIS domain-containing protein n=1 Tax=unclassified Pseudomonas TaxID=196821 RepID=UPI000538CEA6|nr:MULTISPECIES: SIS domain-containing protein [unclassified Pseudomonas]MBD0685648.1 SIS domain-containing protein [Pseudomonas sp. PSB18]CDF97113.1 Glucosamine-6-phosphate deaminase [isomerizing],alternative [Pseudomonas sp. SHC52]
MSLMHIETLSIPDILQRMLEDDHALQALAQTLAANVPDLMITVARGSSDHAAAYFGHALMSQVGVPCLSIPLSLVSLQRAPLRLKNAWVAAFSQSGKSPDLIDSVERLQQLGARTAAFVNTPASPLAEVCDTSMLLPAGLEQSVAATKSFVAMLMAGVQLTANLAASLTNDRALMDALPSLPGQMRAAAGHDWSRAVALLTTADKMLVIGRGSALPIAQEAALKLKETSGIQAEAFSSAEVRHGPMEIIEPGYPVLVFAPSGPEQAGTLTFVDDMRKRGANVLVVAPSGTAGVDLASEPTGHSMLEPFTMIQGFYLMAARLAESRGRDPDQPRFLKKVTETR